MGAHFKTLGQGSSHSTFRSGRSLILPSRPSHFNHVAKIGFGPVEHSKLHVFALIQFHEGRAGKWMRNVLLNYGVTWQSACF